MSSRYIGAGKDADTMFSVLANEGEQRYTTNAAALKYRWRLQNAAFIAFGLEVAFLLLDLGID